MSLKPPKKSDLDKNWMKPRRDKPKKIQPEYHLIITEGTDTEPAYFGAMKEIINSTYSDRIHLGVHGTGDNTLSLFQKAKNMVESSVNGYKHVWVVYDTDDFPPDHINKTAELCISESTEETTYHAIWSNQCIELWFLLHFSFLQSDLHRTSYWPKLTEILTSLDLGEYAKNRTDMYQSLLPYMDTAIANAEKLDKINSGKLPSASAPGTKVYELMCSQSIHQTNHRHIHLSDTNFPRKPSLFRTPEYLQRSFLLFCCTPSIIPLSYLQLFLESPVPLFRIRCSSLMNFSVNAAFV